MVNPLREAFNLWLGLWQVLPLPVREFVNLCLVFAVFCFIVRIIWTARG